MSKKFEEAWISWKGDLHVQGKSHFYIANDVVKDENPDMHIEYKIGDYPDDAYFDAVYEYMWRSGYGRLVRSNFHNDLTLQTSNQFPEFRLALVEQAKRLCKNLEINSLVCDKTGKTLWSSKDTL